MYVFGGIRDGAPIGELACLDTETRMGTFISSGQQQPFHGMSLMNIWNDEIFVFGGANGRLFQPKAMTSVTYMHTTSRKAFGHVLDPAMEVQPINVYDNDAKMAADEACQTLHQASKVLPEALGRVTLLFQ